MDSQLNDLHVTHLSPSQSAAIMLTQPLVVEAWHETTGAWVESYAVAGMKEVKVRHYRQRVKVETLAQEEHEI